MFSKTRFGSTIIISSYYYYCYHAIGGCETVLLESRSNWWHECILWLNIYKTIKSQGLQAFADREGYPNPSIITDDEQQPDFAIVKADTHNDCN